MAASYPNSANRIKKVSTATTTNLKNKTRDAGIGIDSADSYKLKYNANNTIKKVVTEGGSFTSLVPVETVTATNVITAAETGTTFFLSAAAGFESTLPTAAAGLHFKFVVLTAPTSNGYTITGSPADKISGSIVCTGAEDVVNGVTAALADNVILVHNVALVGDYVEFVSDGTLWLVSGVVNTFAAITANG